MNNTMMTLGEYFKEAEAYEYSEEYFDLVKESIEIDLLALYLENYEYMKECVGWAEEVHESVSCMFMEDGNEEVKEETIAGKAKAFFEKIWKGIIRILKAIISPFTALYVFLKKLFSKAEDDTKKTAEEIEKIAENRAKELAEYKEEEEKKKKESDETKEKISNERIEELAKWKEKERSKNEEIQKKISEYIKSLKNGSYSEYYNYIIMDNSHSVEMNSYRLYEPTFDKLIAERIESKEDRNFIYTINRFYFSASIVAPEMMHNLRKRLNDIASNFSSIAAVMDECVNKDGKRYDSESNKYSIKHIKKIIEEFNGYDYTEKYYFHKHVADDLNANLEIATKNMSYVYKDMQTYYQKMQNKKGVVFTKLDYTKYGELFKVISNLQIALNTVTANVRKEISKFYDFRRSMSQTLIEISKILGV